MQGGALRSQGGGVATRCPREPRSLAGSTTSSPGACLAAAVTHCESVCLLQAVEPLFGPLHRAYLVRKWNQVGGARERELHARCCQGVGRCEPRLSRAPNCLLSGG